MLHPPPPLLEATTIAVLCKEVAAKAIEAMVHPVASATACGCGGGDERGHPACIAKGYGSYHQDITVPDSKGSGHGDCESQCLGGHHIGTSSSGGSGPCCGPSSGLHDDGAWADLEH